jgi:UDP-N-acetylmuramyl tripeptide synthase
MPADRGAARALLFARAAAERAGFEPGPPRPRVPTLLVTGSNGKTTTVRLLAAMARAAGLASGLCSTEGIEIAGEHVAQGDWSGPEGAKRVLHDPRSEAAILETARGGILRRGLAVREADAAIVTNLSADHFGEYGIDSLDDLARAKLVVARAVQHGGTLVLNAGDEALMRAAEALPHARAARRALFAADGLHPRLRALRECGGSSCGVADGHLTLHLSGMAHDLCAVEALPLTLGGAARHNIENLAAAALAAAVVGWPVEAIRHVVQTFGRDPLDNPGRLERWHWRGATVLIDYAHNPDGLAQLLALARSLQPRRLLLLLGQAGNRDAAALAALARVVANDAPDLVVLKELPQMLRGRAPGEVSAILRGELIATGFAAGRLQMRPDEAQGARALLDAAEPGDVIVLPLHEAAPRAAVRALLQGAG